MSQIITDVMQKEMTRKEFITTLGFGLLSIFGFSTIVHLLTGRPLGQTNRNASNGYGSNSYGR
jgi:hypothetical protein